MTRSVRWFVAGGLLTAAVLAFWVARVASSAPDGLERVAEEQGIEASPHPLEGGALADYQVTGVEDPGLSTGVAGVIGVAVTFVVAGGLVAIARAAGSGGRAGPDAEQAGA